MPDLLEALRADVAEDETVRLCILRPTPGVSYHAGDEAFFAYSETEHENLRGKFRILQNNGYVEEAVSPDLPAFRLTDDFVAALRSLVRPKGGA